MQGDTQNNSNNVVNGQPNMVNSNPSPVGFNNMVNDDGNTSPMGQAPSQPINPFPIQPNVGQVVSDDIGNQPSMNQSAMGFGSINSVSSNLNQPVVDNKPQDMVNNVDSQSVNPMNSGNMGNLNMNGPVGPMGPQPINPAPMGMSGQPQVPPQGGMPGGFNPNMGPGPNFNNQFGPMGPMPNPNGMSMDMKPPKKKQSAMTYIIIFAILIIAGVGGYFGGIYVYQLTHPDGDVNNPTDSGTTGGNGETAVAFYQFEQCQYSECKVDLAVNTESKQMVYTNLDGMYKITVDDLELLNSAAKPVQINVVADTFVVSYVLGGNIHLVAYSNTGETLFDYSYLVDTNMKISSSLFNVDGSNIGVYGTLVEGNTIVVDGVSIDLCSDNLTGVTGETKVGGYYTITYNGGNQYSNPVLVSDIYYAAENIVCE